MSALSLFNPRLENLDYEYSSPFFNSVWFKDFEGQSSSERILINSKLTYNEKLTSWELTLELSGVSKDKLKLNVKEGLLGISGDKDKGLSTGPFETHYRIPETVDIERIEAAFEHGILTVLMPIESKKSSKEIVIK